MVRFVIRIAAVAILLVLPLVLPVPLLAQTRTSSAGYPNISGEWMEAGVRVHIVQRGSSFTATSSRGSTSWRMDGNVSRDGVVTGKLEHTAGVSPSAKGFAQNRRMTLSPDGRTLKGQATFIGKKGGHSLTWTRIESDRNVDPGWVSCDGEANAQTREGLGWRPSGARKRSAGT